jgi:hypothetical protein
LRFGATFATIARGTVWLSQGQTGTADKEDISDNAMQASPEFDIKYD